MIKLSDDELLAVMAACEPLEPAERADFVRAVANALHDNSPEPGSVDRAIAAVQRGQR